MTSVRLAVWGRLNISGAFLKNIMSTMDSVINAIIRIILPVECFRKNPENINVNIRPMDVAIITSRRKSIMEKR